MTNAARTELFDDLAARVSEGVRAVYPAAEPIEVDVFFADELLFASVTHRGDDGSVLWRSSHAATPDSTAIAALAEAGADLVERIIADARLAAVVGDVAHD